MDLTALLALANTAKSLASWGLHSGDGNLCWTVRGLRGKATYPRVHNQLKARPEQKLSLRGTARQGSEIGQLYRKTQEAPRLFQLLGDSAKGFSAAAQDTEVRQERSAGT